MYNDIVTVFNFYKSSTASTWYPHVLTGVDLVTDKGQMLQRYGADSTDTAELHVSYIETDNQKTIVDGRTGLPILNNVGDPLVWLPPKEWSKQVNDVLDDTITFSTDSFFLYGEWKGGSVNDVDYSSFRYSGFFDYMNQNYDYVFKITSVGGPYTVISHFEIRGA